METLGQRIDFALKIRGASQRKLAEAVGIEQPSINAIIKGKAKGTKHLLPIAAALRVTPEWLLYERGDGPDGSAGLASTDRGQPAPQGLRTPAGWSTPVDTLPVLGTAEGGPDGLLHWNGDVIDRIPRPPALADAKDAYALYVTGTSMVPRYQPGELIQVHPGKPVTQGAFVVVQFHRDGTTPTSSAVVKQFVRRDEKHVVVRQLNPAKDIKIPTNTVRAIHRIVGSSES